MYEERGYREREIPELILTKNLAGMEIDPRAAQIAELALAMCAREHDRRFFRRGVRADVTVLTSIPLGEDELPGNKKLAEELSHLGEIGSLLNPSEDEIDELKAAAASCSDDLFASATKTKLESAAVICEKLSRRFACVVANPPYMGSSGFNPFMSKWVKKNYPDVKSDLFSSFIVRIMDFAGEHGEIGMMTPFVWMFIGSYEKLRNRLIDDKTLTTLIQLEYSGFAGATVPVCTFTYHNSHIDGYKGGYVRLADFTGPAVQAPKALEAIQDPDCGWFYRRDAGTFKQIPGTPIAYWVGDSFLLYCGLDSRLSDFADVQEGLKTSDNDRFIRHWYEVPYQKTNLQSSSINAKWVKHSKGGSYRKWYGNQDEILLFEDGGKALRELKRASLTGQQNYGKKCVSWGRITSDLTSFRYYGPGFIPNMAGLALYPKDGDDFLLLLALLNSSIVTEFIKVTNPTLNVPPGCVSSIPMAKEIDDDASIVTLARQCVDFSKLDWDSFETSWGFKRNPLV